MNEKGIPKPPDIRNWIRLDGEIYILTEEAWRWISRVFTNYPKVQTQDITLDPVAVLANTTSEQTFTVQGLEVQDRVILNKPTHTTGLVIGNVRVSATNTLAVTFGNLTANPIDPPSESYRVSSVRL